MTPASSSPALASPQPYARGGPERIIGDPATPVGPNATLAESSLCSGAGRGLQCRKSELSGDSGAASEKACLPPGGPKPGGTRASVPDGLR